MLNFQEEILRSFARFYYVLFFLKHEVNISDQGYSFSSGPEWKTTRGARPWSNAADPECTRSMREK